MPLGGPRLSFALALPGFSAPATRRIARRLFKFRRGHRRLRLRPSRHRNQLRRRPEWRPWRYHGQHRRQQSRGRLDLNVSRIRSQARVGDRRENIRIAFLHRRLHTHLQRPGHEFIYQFVQAGLPAQMLRPGTQPVPRAPSADTQLAALLRRHKPVVGLLLLRSADVTRYCLPDHGISSSPLSSSAASSIRMAPFLHPPRASLNHRRLQDKSIEEPLESPSSFSSCEREDR